MHLKRNWIIALAVAAAVVVLIVLTVALTPQGTHPAFDAATAFMLAAGKGDEGRAFALLNDTMQAYVSTNCPEGKVSACISRLAPPEWGDFLNVVFRRAAPDGGSWDVQLIANYSADKGFSGVCIYHRMEQTAGEWRVAGWAGFIPCGESSARNLTNNPDTPNRAP